MALWPAKKDQDEDRVEIKVPDLPGASAGDDTAGEDEPGQLHRLTERLGELGELLDQANKQVIAYLTRRQSQVAAGAADEGAAGALSKKIDSLETKLERIDSKLKSLGERTAGAASEDSAGPAPLQAPHGVNQQLAALAEGIRQLQQRVDTGLQDLADLLRTQEPHESASEPATGTDWQRAVLGTELAEHPGLDFQRQQLLGGVLEGDANACALVGQLLVFRSAITEKMPALLKEIGEAYYRWQPKIRPGSNAMEKVLVAWLKETCEDAGISNTIELVDPGQRFDSTRHSATSRGVEITEVRGWIVLRDNGKVYTKAGVAVK